MKQFAQLMVDEHTKALSQLRAASGSATLPSTIDKKHQKVHDKLAALQGAEFDRAYMDAMVDAHKDAEKLLSKRAGHDAARREPVNTGDTAMAGDAAGATGTSGSGTPAQAGDASGTTSGSATPGAVGTSGTSANDTASPSNVDEWAAATLPTVQHHLEQARTLEAQIKQQHDAAKPAAPPAQPQQ